MQVHSWITKSAKVLNNTSIPTAQLDAELILADALNKDRSWLHAHPEYELQSFVVEKLQNLIKRRAKHEPLAYILGKKEFYGREFMISPDVLTPRPETETMVELALQVVKRQRSKVESLQIVDVGTGSGNIIITASLELTQLSNIKYKISFLGLDVSNKALKIAKINSETLCDEKFGHLTKFFIYDLLSQPLTPYLSPQTIVLANLPYIPNGYKINLAARHEPKQAIFGGDDGLDYYRVLFKKLNNTVGCVLTESLQTQHKDLTEIANKSGYKLKTSQDLIQVFVKG